MNYEDIFERYLFDTANQQMVAPGQVDISCMPSDIGVKPGPVLTLKASRTRCIVQLTPELRQYTEDLRTLPADAECLLENSAHLRLGEMCREFYGGSYRIEVLADCKYYCTESGLKHFELAGLRELSEENADEILSALIPGIATKAEYLNREELLHKRPSYVWYQDNKPVGFAGTHQSNMSDEIGNVGLVFIKDDYRGRGAAKVLVSRVAADLIKAGRMPHYGCSVENLPSRRTAEGAGFDIAGYVCRIYADNNLNDQ